ncbi:class I SAM-dependent rRNA methyltransferase [Bacillus sp. RG28]|uniref:Class I SAM-dependent rRNA methyltransferase n=1 Tax=Gottfriedia endophytica TaxID=2820819 RepID=A0A940NLZ3_9BACI|nr:class I SAM-dependent rRNA methyltransferase [Gottfriedia endophytica]MBP0724971.1 class I SAM-dependent rRNA methyltransferase [Gottfriedia endophytica]
MKSEVILKVKKNFVNQYKKGYPLLSKDAIQNEKDLKEEGSLIKLVDDRNQFIARGYYGKQNKGLGWVLTNKDNEKIDQTFFAKKLKQAMNNRLHLFRSTETTAFRMFNGEGDGIGGLTIDYYDGFYVLSWYSKGIYEFKDEVLSFFQENVEYKGIYQKKRFDTKGQYIEEDDFVMGERGEFPLIVKENNVNFSVYLNDGAMVGVFLDQRDVRKTIRDKYAKDKTVLNMFSYTGAFSVFSAVGGATKTTSVDVANRSLAKTIEQFSVNGIDYEAQDIIVEDVFHYFKYAVKKELKFDVVILDPPSFAKTKKVTFSAAKDYKNLLKDTIAITNEKGLIVASTNCSAFNMKKFKGFIETAFQEVGKKYKIVEEFSLPEDFKTIKEFSEGNYLKVIFIRLV